MDQELRTISECVEQMERKTVENVSDNESRPENRTLRNNVQTDHDGMSLKIIKLEAPTFDG